MDSLFKERYLPIDLDEAFADYAWGKYEASLNPFQKLFCKKNQYYIDIRWSNIDFNHVTSRFVIRKDAFSALSRNGSSPNQNPDQSIPGTEKEVSHVINKREPEDKEYASPEVEKDASQKIKNDASPVVENYLGPEVENGTRPKVENDPSHKEVDQSGPEVEKDVTLYRAEFKNRTQSRQSYSFTTTSTTTSTTSIEFHESYTKRKQYNIDISVPGNLVTMGAWASGELSVTELDGETFQSAVSWTVNSDIKVRKGYTTLATIMVSERNSIADFEVQTTMSILDGRDLPVVIRQKSDDKPVGVVVIEDLLDVFLKLGDKCDNISFVKHTDTSRKPDRVRHNVVIVSRGVCKGKSRKDQRVEVNTDKIPGFVIEETEDVESETESV